MNFIETVMKASPVITEGAIIERIRRDASVQLDPYIMHAGLIYEAEGRKALEKLYRQYLDIGRAYDLPIITCTPTWRANPDRISHAGFKKDEDVNGDCFRFLSAIRSEYGEYAKQIFIGGLIGNKGDAYSPVNALSEDESASFHLFQVKSLFEAGVDFLIAVTLPAASEAVGMAKAMAACGLPYILSFVVRSPGLLLDGTPIHEVVAKIDAVVNPEPFCYMINCVHPTIFEAVFKFESGISEIIGDRVLGFQANTSSLSPEELEGSFQLETEDPDIFAESMIYLCKRFGTKILGGCCGTDNRHIESLAKRIIIKNDN